VAETGENPEPLQRLSTWKVYVVTRRLDAQLDSTRPVKALPNERRRRWILSAMC
jgi:hypothetical protein